MMNPKERMRAAFSHREPDRVPVGEIEINEPVATQILGREAWVGYGGSHRGKRFNEMALAGRLDEYYAREAVDKVELARKLELDFLTILPHGKENPRLEPLEENTWRFGDPCGDWAIYRYEPGSDMYAEVDSSLLRGGLPALERLVERMEQAAPDTRGLDFTQVDWIVSEVGQEIFLVGNADIYLGWSGAAAPVYLEAAAANPELIERLLDAQLKHTLAFVRAQIAHGVDAILGGEDWAGHSGPLIAPRLFRRLILPRLQRLTAECHRLGVPFIKHTDGNITRVEDILLVESGIDAYQAIEPAAGMDIVDLKRRYGHRLTLMGNVDCAHLLVYGTPQEVAAETRRVIEACAPGGGFVLTSSNSIHSGVKVENYLAMLEAARQ